MIGKLKHSLKEKCPYCGKILQVRVREFQSLKDGIVITVPIDYICCSNKSCDYERDVEQKRKRN